MNHDTEITQPVYFETKKQSLLYWTLLIIPTSLVTILLMAVFGFLSIDMIKSAAFILGMRK